MRRRATTRAVLAAAVLVGLAACGGDDDGAPAAGSSSTTEAEAAGRSDGEGGRADAATQEFLDEGNAICDEEFAAIDALPEPSSDEEVVALLRTTRDRSGSALDRLRTLTPPAGDEAVLEELYGGVEELVALLDRMVLAAQAGDTAEVDRLFAEGAPVQDAVNEAFTGYGLDHCGAG